MKNGIFLGIAAVAAVGGGAYVSYTYYGNDTSAKSGSSDSGKTISVGGSRRRKKRGQNKNKKSKKT